MRTLRQMWEAFSNYTLKDVPTTHPMHLQLKVVYYKAVRDVLAYQHNVLGDPNTSEEVGARTLQGWLDETEAFLVTLPGARKIEL